MLRVHKADLHIHSCLSPCAELTMSPKTILQFSLARGLDLIAICDHNSSSNCSAVMTAAKKMNIHVLAGMEVSSAEEIHVLALFDDSETALKLQEFVFQNLPGKNDPETFGKQVLVNHKEEVLGFEKRLLIGATTLALDKIVRRIHFLGGLAIASHIDREAFSILGQLGFLPDDLELDALEISSSTGFRLARQKYKTRFPLTSFSDAHAPGDIGKSHTFFSLADRTVAEIRKALRNEEGRRLIYEFD